MSFFRASQYSLSTEIFNCMSSCWIKTNIGFKKEVWRILIEFHSVIFNIINNLHFHRVVWSGLVGAGSEIIVFTVNGKFPSFGFPIHHHPNPGLWKKETSQNCQNVTLLTPSLGQNLQLFKDFFTKVVRSPKILHYYCPANQPLNGHCPLKHIFDFLIPSLTFTRLCLF